MNKSVIATIPQVYTVDILNFDGQPYFGMGSEGKYPLFLMGLDERKMVEVSDVPGGVMCLVVIPGKGKRIVSVMGLFPPFIGKEAAIYIHREKEGGWKTDKLFDLPFAHRCEIITTGSVNWLIAASVSVFKDDPGDWSRPGELYIIPLDAEGGLQEEPRPFMNNITRNHGMIKTNLNGYEAVYISGREGIFEIAPDNESGWQSRLIFDKEVSEFVFFDINNDSAKELITIEPFHGNSLNIYKRSNTGWEKIYRSDLSFGHGLSAGIFKGQPAVAVGNRSDNKALELHTGSQEGKIDKTIIEEGAGPTQTKFFRYKSKDYILSSNQAKGEVTLYS